MNATLSVPFVVKSRQTAKPLRFYVDAQLIPWGSDDDIFQEITDNLNYVLGKTTNLKLDLEGWAVDHGGEVIQSHPAECIDVWIRQGDRIDGGVHNDAVSITTPVIDGSNHRLPAIIAHEIEHICGVWEYNANWTMRDFTSVLPLADVRDGTGKYWDDRPLAKRDPVTGSGGWAVTNIDEWREHAKLCPLSSNLINQYVTFGEWFFSDQWFAVPTNPITVNVKTQPGALVQMFGLENDSATKTQTTAMRVAFADRDGFASFEWGGGAFIATQGNHARLFHANKGNRNGKEWLTVHDLHAHKVLGGGAEGDWHYRGHLPIALN
jgi:hypothetical protein